MFFKKMCLLSGLLVCGVVLAAEKVDISAYIPKAKKATGNVMRALSADEIMTKYGKATTAKMDIMSPQSHGSMDQLGAINQSENFVEDGTVELTFEKLEGGKVKLVTEPKTIIDQIVIDSTKGEVITQDGRVLTVFNEISISQLPVIGKWEGVRWSIQSSDIDKQKFSTASFSIGKITKDGEQKKSIQYESTSMKKMEFKQENFLVLYN